MSPELKKNRHAIIDKRNGESVGFSLESLSRHSSRCFTKKDGRFYYTTKLEKQTDNPHYKYYEICLGCGHKCLTNHI